MEHGWSDDASRPDEPGPHRPVGARFHAGAEQTGTVAGGGQPGGRYPVVMRGYERRRVDAHVAELTAEVERLRAEVVGWQRRWQSTQEYTASLVAELRDRDNGTAPRVEAAAGPIADRVLRHARQEAARIRAVAMKEADAVVARARRELVPRPTPERDGGEDGPQQAQAS